MDAIAPPVPRFRRRHALAALFAVFAAAGLPPLVAQAPPAKITGLSEALEPAPLAQPATELAIVEDLSEEVANHFIDFSYAVQKRDFAAAVEYLTEDFKGYDFADLGTAKPQAPAGGAQATLFDAMPKERRVIGREDFIASLAALVAPLESVEFVFLKTRGAEFESAATVDATSRGVVRQTLNVIGRRAGNRPYAINCWLHGEVVRPAGKWRLRRLLLDKALVAERAAPCFTEVAHGTGVAHRLPPLKEQKSKSFYWRGAATADADGDGRYDIFASSLDRNFLYLNRGDGT
ncbi:MAG: VCBS repeat-containing protein, partial [Planctomycetes bacterium]|nr:VCBS repeat-containing protein [Planctomycetota bacterium]